MSLTPGMRLGPYEIVSLLGAGGMGEVYRAQDPRLGRQVAIKILAAAFSDNEDRAWRFEREARAIASLNHPNICTIHDIGEHDGHRYLVMELMEGQPLDAKLAAGPIPMPALLDLAIQVADALEAAHGAGVIHRDLKPANIFVTKRGEAKLLDFGLAKLSEADAGDGSTLGGSSVADTVTRMSPAKTTLGTLLGTAAYMSPEQARGEPVEAQSDLFSYGAVLYEMATGKVAFGGKTMAVLFDAILNKEPQPIAELNPSLPPELSTIVAKAMEKERELRYQSAADLKADLKRLRRDSSIRKTAANSSATVAPSEPASSPAPPPLPPPAWPPSSMPERMREWRDARKEDRKERRKERASRPRRWWIPIGIMLLIVFGRRWIDRNERPGARSERAALSLANLEVTALTSTGTAARPAISPDGKYVVFLQPESNGIASVWLRQAEATSSVKIMTGQPDRRPQAVTVGEDGSFVDVFTADAKLWRVPFLGGTPKLIVENLATPVGWAPDGRHMAFIRPTVDGRGQELVVSTPDGDEQQVLATTMTSRRPTFASNVPGGTVWAPAWSPNGRRVAVIERLGEDYRDMGIVTFDVDDGRARTVTLQGDVPLGVGWLDNSTLVVPQSLEQGTPSQLWQVSFPEGKRSRLTNDVSRYSEVSVSADRDSLVTTRPETKVSVWVGNVNGAGENVVNSAPFLTSAAYYAMVAWSGSDLYFTHTLNGRFEIFRRSSSGSSPDVVTAGRDMSVAPDGTVVYRSLTGDDLGLWKVDRDGRHPVELAKGTISFPTVTPDGKNVIYSSSISGIQTLWSVPLTGGAPVQLFDIPIGIFGFSNVSPDGRSIALSIDRNWVVCDFPACKTRRPLTNFFGDRPEWTADGRGLAYIDGRTGNLWVAPIDNSPPRQLTHFDDGARIAHFAFASDGRLAVSRVTNSSDIVLIKGLKDRD